MTALLLTKMMIAHFLGDFVFQSRYMAENKSKSFKILLKHVAAYTVCIFFTVAILSGFLQIWAILYWSLVNGILHFVTDFITSRIAGYFYQKGNNDEFWNTIGADQMVHMIIIIHTAALIF